MGLSLQTKKAIDEAFLFRKAFLKKCASEETNAYRLFCGEPEGIPGLVVERLSEVLVFQVHQGNFLLSEDELLSVAEYYLTRTEAKAVYRKVFVPDRSRQAATDEYFAAEPFVGEMAPESIEILENSVRLLVKPYDGYSTGIFLDQRENRACLAEAFSGKTLLNLFSYTCGFSVVAATQGQARTTNVDLSKPYLDWGKRNFLLNGVDLATQEFYAEDVFTCLKRFQKQGRVFDGIVIDPPSFSRTKKGGVFSLKKDLGKLVEAASPLVAPGGALFFSCNYSEWDSTQVERLVKKALPKHRVKLGKLPQAPIDFANEPHPLSQILVRF